MRNWIQNNLQLQPTADMYEGTEPTSPTASWSSDYNALRSAPRRIIYQATIPVSTEYPSGNLTISGSFTITGLNFQRL